MAAKEPVKRVIQQVRPLLSLDREDARRRVLSLYKAWYRTIPFIGELTFKINFCSCNQNIQKFCPKKYIGKMTESLEQLFLELESICYIIDGTFLKIQNKIFS